MFIIDKNAGQGDITPDEFNNIINRAQYSYQNYLIGEIQQYQYGRPISRIDYSQNEKIRQRLSPFVSTPTTLTVVAGVASYPADYILTDAMLTSDNKKVRYAAQDKLANILEDEIDPIDETPTYTIDEDGLTFYPTATANPKLIYIKKAPAIVYATELDVNGREVYDPANSVDPVWNEMDCMEIVVRALAIMGVPLQLGQVQAYAQNIKQNGQ